MRWLLKLIWGKTLPIAVVWSTLYPTLFGDIVIRGLQFPGVPAEELFVRKAVVELRWGTLSDPVTRVRRVQLSDPVISISLDDPLKLIRHLRRSGRCKLGRPDCEGADGGDSTVSRREAQSDTRSTSTPLKLLVEELSASGGTIEVVASGASPLRFDIVRIGAAEVPLPLETASLRATAYLRTRPVEGSPRTVPIVVRADLRPGENEAYLTFSTKDFPLAALNASLGRVPAFSGILRGLLPFENIPGGPAEQSGVAVLEGTLTGTFTVKYDRKSSPQWTLVSDSPPRP